MKLLTLAGILGLMALGGCTRLAMTAANVPAAFGDYAHQRNLPYGSEARQRLDAYLPSHGADVTHPIVVFLYGGGWTAGAKEQYRFVAEALVSRGMVVVIPDYRLYPEVRFPAFVEDAAQAVRWTRENAAALHGDPERLFLAGHSAGAQIAALLAFDERYLEAEGGGSHWIRGFVGLSGPYDFLPLDPKLQEIFAPAARMQDTQPIDFVHGTEPPVLLMHGEADERVEPRNSRSLAEHIRESGGQVRERYFAAMSHGGILAALSVYFRGKEPVLDEIVRFIEDAGATGIADSVAGL